MKKIDFFVILAVVTLIALAVCMVWLSGGIVAGSVEWWSPVVVVLAFVHLCYQLYRYWKGLKVEEPANEMSVEE